MREVASFAAELRIAATIYLLIGVRVGLLADLPAASFYSAGLDRDKPH